MINSSENNVRRPLFWLQILIVAITLIAIAVIIFLGSRTHFEIREINIEQFNQQQLILVRSTAAGIEVYFKELSAALSSLTKIPSIQLMTPECLQCIQHTYWSLPSRTSIRLLDRNGVLGFIYPFDDWRGDLIGRDYSKEAYFQEARETSQITISGLITNEQGETRIRIAVPIYLTYKTKTVKVGDRTGVIVAPIDPSKPESGRFQGILIGSFDPLTIAEKFVSPIVSGKTGYSWLLSEESIFIAHHEEEFVGHNAFEVRKERNPDISYQAIEEIQRRMIAGKEGVGRYISGWHLGEKEVSEKLIAYTPVHIDNHIWSVAVCAPVSEVGEIIQKTKRSIQYIFAFVFLALIIGVSFFFITTHRWSLSLEQEVARQTKELTKTSSYLNNLIRYANTPIIVWNPYMKITIFNQAFEKMSGQNEEEMLKQSLDVLFPEESRSDSLDKIERTLTGEHWETVEIPILCKDGKIRIVLWNSANIYGEDGKTLIATIAQGQDITERKKTEDALQKSEGRYRTLQANIPVGIFRTTPKGRFLSANPALIEMLGYDSEDEMLAVSVVDIYEIPKRRGEFLKRMNKEGLVVDFEVKLRHKDGLTFWGSLSATAVTDRTGKVIHYDGILKDVTERKHAEQELKKRLGQLEVYYKATIGREGRIIELKHEVNKLLEELGKKKKYGM